MGVVYEALHVPTRRRRALKTLLPKLLSDAEAQARFRLEAVVAADVDSEHIVEVLDAGVDSATGLPFLVMELLRGENLAERLRRQGALPAAEVVSLLRQITGALDRMHAAGVVHRDLKPENLFLAERADAGVRVTLLDFGVAKVVAESSLASTTRSLGTPAYMSPEQIRGDGDIGPGADLYALGQLAFALLVGTSYWDAETRGHGVYGLLVKIMAGGVEPARARAAGRGVSDLPAEFDAWFARATALEVSERFDSAAELVDTLSNVFSLSTPATTPRGVRAVPQEAPGAESATLEAVAVGKNRGSDSSPSLKGGASLAAVAQAGRRKLRATWLLLPAAAATWAGMRWAQSSRVVDTRSTSPAAWTSRAAVSSAPRPAVSAAVLEATVPVVRPGDSAAPLASSAGRNAPPQRSSKMARTPNKPAPGAGPTHAIRQPVDPTDIR
jgi:serine/threonine-protein kinase